MQRPPPKGDQQPDLFCACFADIPIRDQRDMMERPFFSLAKKPRHRPIEYEVGNVFVRVSPNKEHGIATIWDADVLIWAATQITEALDRGVEPSRTLEFHPYNLLKAINRMVDSHLPLLATLQRGTGVPVKTDSLPISTGMRPVFGRYTCHSWCQVCLRQPIEIPTLVLRLSLRLTQRTGGRKVCLEDLSAKCLFPSPQGG
jgi:plasmid replication initiation protein